MPKSDLRKCAVCVHGTNHGTKLTRAAPSAACVLAFSRSRMEGPDGVLELIEGMTGGEAVPMASAYCKACRRTTWLCSADLDLSAAAVDFWQRWHASGNIKRALAIIRKHCSQKKSRDR
jgi:hypothetical protein